MKRARSPMCAEYHLGRRRVRACSPTPECVSDRPMKRQRTSWVHSLERRILAKGVETNARRLAQRQKQIDFGKNTIAYDRFIAVCPRHERIRGDPMTPLVNQKCSKRSFIGQITSWKKMVYAYVAEMDDDAASGSAGSRGSRRSRGSRSSRGSDGSGNGGGNSSGKGDDSGEVDEVEKLDRFVLPSSIEKSNAEGLKQEGEEMDEVDDWFSELDDIELDDQGNVIVSSSGSRSGSGSGSGESSSASGAGSSGAGAGSSSIFDAFDEQ